MRTLLRSAATAGVVFVLGLGVWAAWPHYQMTRAAWLLTAPDPASSFRWPEQTTFAANSAAVPAAASQILHFVDAAESRLGRSAQSLYLRGRAFLLLGDFDQGIDSFHLARLLSPGDPKLDFALAVGLAGRAIHEDRPHDFAHALELLLRAAESPALRLAAHFNVALILEATPAPIHAASFWKLTLDEETGADWRRETELHFVISTERLAQRKERIEKVLAGGGIDEPGAAELLIQQALTKWLSDRSHFESQLRSLAVFLSRNRKDMWLTDLLSRQSSSPEDKLLSEAAAANLSGRHHEAAVAAETAGAYYASTQNVAGELAAALELAYSHARLGESRPCLAALKSVRARAAVHSYTWMQNRAWFEEITCATQARTVDVMAERERAAREIPAVGYTGLTLRAKAAMTEPFHSFTTPRAAWRTAQEGLQMYWRSVLPGGLASNFYVPLALAAETENHLRASVLLMEEAAAVLEDHPNHYLRAQVQSELGRLRIRNRDWRSGSESLTQAARLYPAPEDVRRAEGAAEIALAESDLSSGTNESALRRLNGFVRGEALPYNGVEYYNRLRLLAVFGDSLLAAGQVAAGLDHYKTATDESLTRVRSLHDRAQREATLREVEASWRGLVAAQLANSDYSGALKSWQTFRGLLDPNELSALPFRNRNEIWLSYILLPKGAGLWLMSSSGVEFHHIEAADLPQQVQRFAALVANPDSPGALVEDISRQLYRTLMEPVSREMNNAKTLIIDADGALSLVPWAALRNRAGEPLLVSHPLVQTTGWASVLKNRTNVPPVLEPALIVADPNLGSSAYKQFPVLIDARREAESLRGRFANVSYLAGSDANVERVQRELPLHHLLHFAGHGLANGGSGALVLAQDNTAPLRLLTAETLANLDLRALSVVVLSACSSGIGESAGIVQLDTLVQAFLAGGAGRVVAARWNVDSRATASLMSEFYSALRNGQTPAAALRAAQLAIYLKSPEAAPHSWAAFQVYGAP